MRVKTVVKTATAKLKLITMYLSIIERVQTKEIINASTSMGENTCMKNSAGNMNNPNFLYF